MSLVGIEEHWTFGPLDQALRDRPPAGRDPSLALNDHGDAGARLADVGDLRIATMDAQGVDVQVLALAPPGAQGLPTAESIALSRDANDCAAELVRRRPDRFRAMATLPLGSPAEAAAELERVTSLGLRGAMVHGRSGDVLLDDARLDDLWSVAAALGHPVFVHPQVPPESIRAAYSGLGAQADLALATYAWGWHLEAGTAALRLMAAGTLDRHPGLQLVLGHWGELLLFWHDRADGLARAAGLERSITEYLQQNVWITASGMLDPAMLTHALAVTTTDRILFSTDYPFQVPSREEVTAFLDAIPDETARHAVAAGNAAALFGIG